MLVSALLCVVSCVTVVSFILVVVGSSQSVHCSLFYPCWLVADLIMLGLATHEPNFTIIREEFKPNKPKPCGLCNQFGHEVKDCEGLPREKKGKVGTLKW